MPALLYEAAAPEGAFLRDRKNSSVPSWLQINPNTAALMMATLGALCGGGAGHGFELFGRSSCFLVLALPGASRAGFRRGFGLAAWLCSSESFELTAWSHSSGAPDSAAEPHSSSSSGLTS